MTKIITAQSLQDIVKEEVKAMITLAHELTDVERQPRVVIITATQDKASHRYVDNKLKMAKEFGINAEKIEFDPSITTNDLEKVIEGFNNNEDVDGIILQLPIYDHLEPEYLLNVIDFDKDVDGLTLMSKAFLEHNDINYMPCTTAGIIFLLEANGVKYDDIIGKNVVVVGRGETSGAPTSIAFRHLDANVTVLHSKTKEKDLEFYIRNADIVISCVGKRYLLKADWFKKDSIVIGVGFTYDESGKQHLDFEVDKVVELGRAAMVTNRVNCTGKATVLSLLYNTVLAFLRTLTLEKE